MASIICHAETYVGEASNRVKINLGETPWKFIRSDPPNLAAKAPTYNDAAGIDVGIPHTWNDSESFRQPDLRGGGDGRRCPAARSGTESTSRSTASTQGKKIFVEFEGVHVGRQVYVNGTFIPGNSAVNPQATHVIGFIAFRRSISPT